MRFSLCVNLSRRFYRLLVASSAGARLSRKLSAIIARVSPAFHRYLTTWISPVAYEPYAAARAKKSVKSGLVATPSPDEEVFPFEKAPFDSVFGDEALRYSPEVEAIFYRILNRLDDRA